MKRQYMVVKATQRDVSGITVDGKPMQFGKKTNAFEVNDPGVAHEIEAEHGIKATGEVVVVPHFTDSEPGHHYSFLVPDLPWKRKQEGSK